MDFERIAKLFPLTLAAVYVVGFLVVALHLAKYGASSLELFKSQYIAAGFWCGSAFAAYLVFTVPARSHFADQIADRGIFAHHSFLARLTPSLLVNALFVGFVLVIRYPMHRLPWVSPLPKEQSPAGIMGLGQASLLPLVLSLAAFFILQDLCLALKEESKELRRSRTWWRYSFRWTAVFLTILFLQCVLTFAHDVYPAIPFSLGGGRPRSVIFTVNRSGDYADSFLEMDGKGRYTVPYELLLENEGSFVVVSPKDGQRAIEFDRKAITSMVVLGKSSQGR